MNGTEDGSALRREPLAVTITAANELSAARARVRSWLRGTIPDEQTDEILLASGEALANALEHGVTPITLTLEWVDNTLNLSVRDAGAWRAGAESSSAASRRRGLGIPIMTALTDNLTFETTDGTTVKLSRRFGV